MKEKHTDPTQPAGQLVVIQLDPVVLMQVRELELLSSHI